MGNFVVNYQQRQRTKQKPVALEQEIGEKEGELIRLHRPPLNTQIPKSEDWRKYDYHKIDEDKIIKILTDTEKAGDV